ncbi:MAG TPA: NTP transferase domain-containing protein [Candidatus Bathyarchaeia archaeon]
MGVTAVVMAGGKGKRMGLSEEKPLLRVGGKPVIEIVLRSLLSAKHVELVVVAVSDSTPKTARFVSRFPVKIVVTPGNGYIEDMQFVVKQFHLEKILTIAADLPLITAKVVDKIIAHYEECDKPAMAVVTPLDLKSKLGLGAEYTFNFDGKQVVPVGINAIDGQKINDYEIEQEIFLMESPEVAVNINTTEELNLAQRLLGIR